MIFSTELLSLQDKSNTPHFMVNWCENSLEVTAFKYILFQKCESKMFIMFIFISFDRITRSSNPEMFCKKGVLKNFENLTGNNCAEVSFLLKYRPEAQNFIKKETPTQVFSCEFCKIYKSTLFTE